MNESTTVLLHRIWDGDLAAREQLARAYLPILKRVAHGRLPANARGMIDTDDLVSVTLTNAFQGLATFQPRREGAFLSFLYRILLNRIRDEIRRQRVRPASISAEVDAVADRPSPLEEMIGRERIERYEAALEKLTDEQREVVVLRLEMGIPHRQIAEALGLSSPDAARVCLSRAYVRLAEAMRDEA